ncbi:MAG: hypothetical protein QFC55_00590 [Chloroflexota bacterium]|nr:hypothetical protein [Chloroflexota bacterium]
MANRILAGAIAGAAGVVALNAASYLDMLVRGRPASDMPARVAGALANEMGLPLVGESDDDEDERAANGVEANDDDTDDLAEDGPANRREAMGALLGIANGIGIGIVYGIVRLILPRPPAWLAGAALGAAAMAASDYPATRLGLTEPRDWTATDWASDVLPHMVFGIVTAITFEAARD